MLKVSLSHKNLNQKELKNRAELHIHKMNKNAAYSDFQPNVTLLETTTLEYSKALNDAEDGGKPLTRIKLKIKDDLTKFITDIAINVQEKANKLPESEGVEFILGAGFEIQEATVKKAITRLDTPSFLSVVRVKKGVILLKWARIENAITYMIEVLDKDGNWTIHHFCTKNNLELSGFEPDSKQTFRIKAVGPESLASAVSETVSVLA